MLLKVAIEAGWYCQESALPHEWDVIARGFKKAAARNLVVFLANLGRTPSRADEADLEVWCRLRIEQGLSAQYAIRVCADLRLAVSKSLGGRQNTAFQKIRTPYSLCLSKMPPTLRSEILSIVLWKTAEFQPDRLAKGRLREVSANRLVQTFEYLAGYACHVALLGPIDSVSALVTKQLVEQFAAWSINVRKLKADPFRSSLGMIYAVLRYHPLYKSLDFSWFEELSKSLPRDARGEIDARKAARIIPYAEAEKIHLHIRARRLGSKYLTEREKAVRVRDELLILWLLLLPIRQLNIRLCRVGGPKPNLFRSTIRPYSNVSKSSWASQLETNVVDPQFWQLQYAIHETKTKNQVHTLISSELVPLLEEYISCHRNVILEGVMKLRV